MDLEKALRLQEELYIDKAYKMGITFDRIAKYFAEHGQFGKAASYCQKSLDIVCKHFGTSSIEAAEESFKLCTLLFNAHEMDPRQVKEKIQETIEIFKRMGLDQQMPNDYQELLDMFQQSQLRAFYF